MDNGIILTTYFLTGFFGDLCLQLITSNSQKDWGLKEYFSQHGRPESLFIAGGMLTFFMIIYLYIFRMPLQRRSYTSYLYLSIYGILLDLFFRETMIFSSLQGYYDNLNYFESAVWGAIPMMLPLAVLDLFGYFKTNHVDFIL